MRILLSSLIVLLITLSFGFSLSANAELYATSQAVEAFDVEEQQSFLNKIDPDTGEPTRIGGMGVQDCIGLDFEPITNRLFGVCERLKENPDMPILIGPDNPELAPETRVDPEDVGQILVLIDVETGMATEIGPLGISPDQTDSGVTDISFNPNGVLFGVVTSFPDNPGDGGMEVIDEEIILNPEARVLPEITEATLLRINTTTGEASIVGATGTGGIFGTIGHSPIGKLYHTAENFEDAATHMLNESTALASKLADIVYPVGPESLRLIYSMDFSTEKNKLFSMLLIFPQQPDGRDLTDDELAPRVDFSIPGFYLTTIDPQTGVISGVGPTDLIDADGNPPEFFGAIAALNQDERQVPTMSEWGLIITGVLFLGAAVVYLRRRKQIMEG